MKNKKERAQALSDALDQLDDGMLRDAYDVDDAEKFRALGSSKAVKSEKTRTVTRFHLYTAVAACLVLAIGISMIVLENVPYFNPWGPGIGTTPGTMMNSVSTAPSTVPSSSVPEPDSPVLDTLTVDDEIRALLGADEDDLVFRMWLGNPYYTEDISEWSAQKHLFINHVYYAVVPDGSPFYHIAGYDFPNVTIYQIVDGEAQIYSDPQSSRDTNMEYCCAKYLVQDLPRILAALGENVVVNSLYYFSAGHGGDFMIFETSNGPYVWYREPIASEAEYMFPLNAYIELCKASKKFVEENSGDFLFNFFYAGPYFDMEPYFIYSNEMEE